MITWKARIMPVDEPMTSADELFAILRILKTHWDRALDNPPQKGCLECREVGNCPQLKWASELMAEIASVMFQK